LRSSGKGANRTILDCLFRPVGWDEVVFFAAAGAAGAGSLSRLVWALPGRFHRRQLRKGLES
jgi:hypothetical protein